MEVLRSEGEEERVVIRYERRRVPNGRIDSGAFRHPVGLTDAALAELEYWIVVAAALLGLHSWRFRLV